MEALSIKIYAKTTDALSWIQINLHTVVLTVKLPPFKSHGCTHSPSIAQCWWATANLAITFDLPCQAHDSIINCAVLWCCEWYYLTSTFSHFIKSTFELQDHNEHKLTRPKIVLTLLLLPKSPLVLGPFYWMPLGRGGLDLCLCCRRMMCTDLQ